MPTLSYFCASLWVIAGAGGTAETSFSQYGQDIYVEKLFPENYRGRFVEVGAHNGLHLSNTLRLERMGGWRGLLIEASPSRLEPLRANRPEAQIVQACVAGVPGVRHFSLTTSTFLDERSQAGDSIDVRCETLESVLLQYGFHHVDYLSLDVEGEDLNVLRSLTGQVDIDVISIDLSSAVFQQGRWRGATAQTRRAPKWLH